MAAAAAAPTTTATATVVADSGAANIQVSKPPAGTEREIYLKDYKAYPYALDEVSKGQRRWSRIHGLMMMMGGGGSGPGKVGEGGKKGYGMPSIVGMSGMMSGTMSGFGNSELGCLQRCLECPSFWDWQFGAGMSGMMSRIGNSELGCLERCLELRVRNWSA